jgi:hypothetical protein
MQAKLINTINEFKSLNTRNGMRGLVSICVFDEKMADYWMSIKQAVKLKDCYFKLPEAKDDARYSTKNVRLWGIFDDDRYIWCGIDSYKYSEIAFLNEKFNVNIESISSNLLPNQSVNEYGDIIQVIKPDYIEPIANNNIPELQR